ncbi:MAG: hypothetical protein GQ474_08075 [Sulfurimonas sp.]|nr:hypothetical protein [Sulfurimonas sp.]
MDRITYIESRLEGAALVGFKYAGSYLSDIDNNPYDEGSDNYYEWLEGYITRLNEV